LYSAISGLVENDVCDLAVSLSLELEPWLAHTLSILVLDDVVDGPDLACVPGTPLKTMPAVCLSHVTPTPSSTGYRSHLPS
jgi:hypothetical protein